MAVIERFRALYKDLATMNISELDDVYHTDIEFIDPVTTHSGIAAVRRYFGGLLEDAQKCEFCIHHILNCENQTDEIDHVVIWTMTLETKMLNKGNPVVLEGTSMLKVQDDRIIYHKDYYDLGQMVYEHIPFIRFFVKAIKKRLAKS